MEEEQEPKRHFTIAKQQILRRYFENIPDAFEERYVALFELKAAFQDELAKATELSLRQHLDAQPQDTIEDRRRLSAALQERLDDLGLSLADARTGQRVQLSTDDEQGVTGLDGPPTGRYVLVHTDSLGRRTATQVADRLPEFAVVDGADAIPPPIIRWGRRDPPSARGQ